MPRQLQPLLRRHLLMHAEQRLAAAMARVALVKAAAAAKAQVRMAREVEEGSPPPPRHSQVEVVVATQYHSRAAVEAMALAHLALVEVVAKAPAKGAGLPQGAGLGCETLRRQG